MEFLINLKRPVSELISERMPATLELVLVSALLAISVGVLLGVYTGIHRDSFLSKVILVLSLAGVSLPTFIIGIMLIYLFSVILGVLPSFGRGQVVDLGFLDHRFSNNFWIKSSHTSFGDVESFSNDLCNQTCSS